MIAPTLTNDGFNSASDEALMGAITDRDEDALQALYQRHGETLRSIIESVIHEQAEAEDVLRHIAIDDHDFIILGERVDGHRPTVGDEGERPEN